MSLKLPYRGKMIRIYMVTYCRKLNVITFRVFICLFFSFKRGLLPAVILCQALIVILLNVQVISYCFKKYIKVHLKIVYCIGSFFWEL